MESTTDRSSDACPVHDTCDVCRHPHACYVGGRPAVDPPTQATRWEVHVCLGCLMRAGAPAAIVGRGDCRLPASWGAAGGPRYA